MKADEPTQDSIAKIHDKPSAQLDEPKEDVEKKPIVPSSKFVMKLSNNSGKMKPIPLMNKTPKPAKALNLMTLDDDCWEPEEDISSTTNEQVSGSVHSFSVSKLSASHAEINSRKGWHNISDKSRAAITTNTKIDSLKITKGQTSSKVSDSKTTTMLSQLSKWKTKRRELFEEEAEEEKVENENETKLSENTKPELNIKGSELNMNTQTGSCVTKNENTAFNVFENSNKIQVNNDETTKYQYSSKTEECLAAAEQLRLTLINKNNTQESGKAVKSAKGGGWKKVSNLSSHHFVSNYNTKGSNSGKDIKHQEDLNKPSKFAISFSPSSEKFLENERLDQTQKEVNDDNFQTTNERNFIPGSNTNKNEQDNEKHDFNNKESELTSTFGLGAKMLQGMGWSVNTGLGTNGSGIKTAIIPTKIYSSGAGLGASEECISQVEYEKSVERGNLKRKNIKDSLRERAARSLNKPNVFL